MIDTATYVMTERQHGGPLIREEDDFLAESLSGARLSEPVSRGAAIGSLIGICLIAATVAYLLLAV